MSYKINRDRVKLLMRKKLESLNVKDRVKGVF